MARMSIDDSIARDPRITVLAKVLGWTRRETVGCLVLDVWPICYDQRTHLVSERLIDAAAGHDGFAAALVECELAKRDRGGRVHVCGAKERVAYLEAKRRAGSQGGAKSAETRRNQVKQTSSTNRSTPQARRNPSVPDPSSASASSPVPDGDRDPVSSASPARPGFVPTKGEAESARRVLSRLSEHNAVDYTAPSHTRVIVERMREGTSELELRAVVLYAVEVLHWNREPFVGNLSPQVLFGTREKLDKHLDAARSRYRDAIAAEIAKEAPQHMGGAA